MSDAPTAETSAEVFLPDAVRRAAARANELVARQGAPAADGSDSPPEPSLPPSEQPPTSEPPPPAPEPEPEPPPQTAEWEQRYRTLQGKYDTEISGLRGQVAGLERLLSTIQASPQQPPAPQPGAPVHYNDDDVQLFGEDLLQAATRAAEARYHSTISELQNKIARLEGGQQQFAGQRLQDQVFDTLDRDPELVGRWDKINTSPDFHAWLQQVDEYAGVTRFEMLQHAYLNGDAVRTGRFFKKYMAEHTVQPPTATPSQTVPAPAPRQNGHAAPAGSPRLEDFAAPGRAAGSGQSGNGAPPPRIWSRPEITAFYRDRTDGRYRGREAEAERLEQDLFAANREGRIQ